jgi:putative oxidoreductase
MQSVDYGLLLARLLMCAVYIWSGIGKALDWPGGLAEISAAGLPLAPILLSATILVQILGGLSLALGFWARLGALALAGFTLVASVLFHNFWVATDPILYQHQMATFLEHIAIIGGFTALAATGSGGLSLDRYFGLDIDAWVWERPVS